MKEGHVNTNFSENKTEAAEAVDFSNLLPRAVFRSNAFALLDGEWRFSIDQEDKGLLESWFLNHEYKDTAQWPGTVEEHMLQARGQQFASSTPEKVIAWYEREFPMPAPGLQTAHNMLQITFGACGFETRVWINGLPLRTIEGEDVHYGEYTSFSYELDKEILRPVNRLTVRIADTMDADIPRGKQESHVYKRGGIWYHAYSGPVRSIWLEAVERNRLRSRVGVVTELEDQLIRFNFTTLVHDPGIYELRVKIFEKNGEDDEPLASSTFPLPLEVGQKHQRVVVELPSAIWWSPETPHLYRLEAQLVDSGGYIAEIRTYFGLRQIEAKGNFVFLNNKRVYLDGILYQPGMATYEQTRLHMQAIKSLGCNLMRIHIAGVDPRIYNLADEIGLMLWVEVPSPHSSNNISRQNHYAELLRMLNMIENHPSVVIWSLYNEDWGAQDIATNIKTRQYIIDTYHYMKIKHPQFLVVDNDGWHHISMEGRMKSDLLTAHLYTPEITRWRELLDRLVKGDLEGVAAYPLVVGDPFFYRKQIPLIVSEWGGFGFVDYGGPEEAHQRGDRIRQFKQEFRNRPIAGDVYTQATNIEEERNGLIDFSTGELIVPEGLLSSVEVTRHE